MSRAFLRKLSRARKNMSREKKNTDVDCHEAVGKINFVQKTFTSHFSPVWPAQWVVLGALGCLVRSTGGNVRWQAKCQTAPQNRKKRRLNKGTVEEGNSLLVGGEFEALVSLSLITVIFEYLVRTFRNLNMASDPQWGRPEVDEPSRPPSIYLFRVD